MAKVLFLHLLFLLAAIMIISTAQPSPSTNIASPSSHYPSVPTQSPSSTRATPPPEVVQEDQQQQQQEVQVLINDIIDALTGSGGDFRGWADLLFSISSNNNNNNNNNNNHPLAKALLQTLMTSLSSRSRSRSRRRRFGGIDGGIDLSATVFIPSDEALSHLPTPTTTTNNNMLLLLMNMGWGLGLDPFVIPYHIVPQRLSFSDLRLFNPHTRLPTLLPSSYILITNNSLSNFTIDASRITHPDLFVNSALCLHGITNILDYTIYGSGTTITSGGGNGLIFPPPPMAQTTVEAVAAAPRLCIHIINLLVMIILGF